MKNFTLVIAAIIIQLSFSFSAHAQCYSNRTSPVNGTDYSSSVNGICIGCSASNVPYAADESLTNYASVSLPVAVLGRLELN